MNKKYVCLKGIKQGNKFYTMNNENPEKLNDGTIAYEILGYADTDEEALKILNYNDADMTNYILHTLTYPFLCEDIKNE